MNRTQEIRHECLLQLYGAKELGVTAAHVRKKAKREGFDYSEQEVGDALFFLAGQEFAKRLQEPATGVVRYQITSKGMLEYENAQ